MNARRIKAARKLTKKGFTILDEGFVFRRASSPWLRFLARILPRFAARLDERAIDRYLQRRATVYKTTAHNIARRPR